MKINWDIIKFIILVGIIATLYSFSIKRNTVRKLTNINVEFIDENSPFITLDAVNKLLIQSFDSITSIDKETLVLNKMEARLLENPMIKNAEVYLTVDGVVGARIEQRKPIARVTASQDFYIDDEGKKMPLSKVHSARVPLVTGQIKINNKEFSDLLFKINMDEYMKKNVIGLNVTKDGSVTMNLRRVDFLVEFGNAIRIEKKFQKLKAFNKRINQDSLQFMYSSVNLRYKDQVIATKKINHGE
jgi:cell division protein FtsQ